MCNRCGRCCHYLKDGRWKRCKYLVLHGKISSCRIWPNNVGTVIDDGIVCMRMQDLDHTYVGCTYNAGSPVVNVPIDPYRD